MPIRQVSPYCAEFETEQADAGVLKMQQRLMLAVAVVGMLAGCGNADFKGSAGKIHPTITKEFNQDSYPAASTTRQQGSSGDAQGENFEQGEWGKLDVLVVIDNSG